jgi:hypothetical protein
MSWYRMHRGWQDHEVFGGEPFSKRDAFVYLVENAAFRASRVNAPAGQVDLQRGQLCTSLRYLAKAWGWSEAKVRRCLTSLKKSEIIDAHTDAGQTVITICNYEKYQGEGCVADATTDARPTQQPRVADANYKKDKEDKELREEVARDAREPVSPSAGKYAFDGETIRLIARDYDKWLSTFHAIPDLRAELVSIDAWFADQPEEKRGKWFLLTTQMLSKKHQEIMAWRQLNEPADDRSSGQLSTAEYYRRMDAKTREAMSREKLN